jgi:hypothetical protein
METAPLCTIQSGSGFGDVWLTTTGPSYTLDTSHPHLLALPTRSEPTAPLPRDSPPSPQARSISENQRGEILTADIAASLSSGGGKPGQGYPAVMIRMAAPQGDLDHAAAWSAATTGQAAPTAAGGQQAPVVAGTLTARCGKGANSTVDDSAMVIHTPQRGPHRTFRNQAQPVAQDVTEYGDIRRLEQQDGPRSQVSGGNTP